MHDIVTGSYLPLGSYFYYICKISKVIANYFFPVWNPEKLRTLIGLCLVQLSMIWGAHLGHLCQHYNFKVFCSQIKLRTSYN